MKTQNRISRKFAELKLSGETGLITFITAGDPNLERTRELVLTLEAAGADFIELGVPYSDPLADGPVIQQASQRALRSGTNLTKILAMVKDLRSQTDIPLILMTYYNPLFRYGINRIAADAANAGVDGFIVPDLPFEEAEPFQAELSSGGLYLIPLVAPTSGQERISMISEQAEGFVYCVSLTGVTGVREGLPDNLQEFMKTVSDSIKIPAAVGFGISSPEQAAKVSQYCDAIIVGSALVKTIGETGDSSELNSVIYEMVRQLKKPLQPITSKNGGSLPEVN